MKKNIPLAGLVIALTVLLVAGLLVKRPPRPPVVPPPVEAPPTAEAPPELVLKPVAFTELDGWSDDYHALALKTFLTSCERILPQPEDRAMGGAGFAGTIGDWKPVCTKAAAVPEDDHGAARTFFEDTFQPAAVLTSDPETGETIEKGLFTGYYVPVVEGRRAADSRFRHPLHGRPADLISVDLGAFREQLKGRSIDGRVSGSRLVPYHSRADIVSGVLDEHDLEIMWLDDPVDAFFMQIQGSGLIRLEDGALVRLGFAGKNGLPYTSVGRILVERGEMTLDQASMQSIRQWVMDHPQEADDLLNENASYVFFEEQNEAGAIGAQNVVLTAGRSLAIDRAQMPLGAPFWLEIGSSPEESESAIRRLMVAQDTGGAIVGPIRGDFFWGEGDEAGQVAGRMKDRGRYFILLPKAVSARLPQNAGS